MNKLLTTITLLCFSVAANAEIYVCGPKTTTFINWFLYEADYFQYSQGLMTGSVWQAKLHAMDVNLKGCAYPEIYEMRVGLVEGEFKSVLDNMPSQCTE